MRFVVQCDFCGIPWPPITRYPFATKLFNWCYNLGTLSWCLYSPMMSESYLNPTHSQVTLWLMIVWPSTHHWQSKSVPSQVVQMHTWVWGCEGLGPSTPFILLEAKVSQLWSLRPYLPLFTNPIHDLLGNTSFLGSDFYLSASLKGPFWPLSLTKYLASLDLLLPILLCHFCPFLQNFTNHPGPVSTPVHPQSTLGIWSFSLFWTNVPHPFTLIGRVPQGNSCNSHSH